MGFRNSPENAASFATAGSVFITDDSLPVGQKAYGLQVWSDTAQITALTSNGIGNASKTILTGLTLQRGDTLWGLGDITALTVTGTVQAYLIDPPSA